MRPLSGIFLLFSLAGLACSDSNGLADATIANAEHTDTLWSLIGTPVSTPSGYSVEGSRRVRTDLFIDFDFAYSLEQDGSHVFIPRAALGIDTATTVSATSTVNPGLQARTETFETITEAPSNGYIVDRAVPVAVGERYLVRGRVTCDVGVPKYGKLELLAFNDDLGIVTFRILTDDNCGFRSLKPGLPDR